MGHLPRLATNRVGYHLGKGDRVLSRSRVISIESPAVGWLAVAVASVGKTAIERVKVECNETDGLFAFITKNPQPPQVLRVFFKKMCQV